MASLDKRSAPDSDRENRVFILRIIDENRDLEERARNLGVITSYDAEDDVWLATIGEPAEALTETIDDELLLRVTPKTLKIVGLEILGLRRFLMGRPDHLPFFLHLIHELGAGVPAIGTSPDAESPSSLSEDIRSLVLA